MGISLYAVLEVKKKAAIEELARLKAICKGHPIKRFRFREMIAECEATIKTYDEVLLIIGNDVWERKD